MKPQNYRMTWKGPLKLDEAESDQDGQIVDVDACIKDWIRADDLQEEGTPKEKETDML